MVFPPGTTQTWPTECQRSCRRWLVAAGRVGAGWSGVPAVKLGQHTGRDIDEQPAQALVTRAWPVARGGPGEQLPLGSHLCPCVPGANHDESAARVPFLRIVAHIGKLDLPDEMIAQVQRLGDAAPAAQAFARRGNPRNPPPATTTRWRAPVESSH
jgi:hypothetical protein